MEGLNVKKYTQTTRKRFDPLALAVSTVGLVAVLAGVGGISTYDYFLNIQSILIVFGGTFASILFQFDFSSCLYSWLIIVKSFLGTPDTKVLRLIRELDATIVGGGSILELREGQDITGELLNDILCMYRAGLLYEEIEEFVTSRVSDEYLNRQISVTMMNRGAVVAPALGLFGTVIGLILVLKNLSDPAQIAPSMSLALMTTAYGAGLGSLIFTPLAGRLEHHNHIFIEIHQQLISKINILIKREERNLHHQNKPRAQAG
jgi:chemotaxis protein MotA